jgi:hypothetical protein
MVLSRAGRLGRSTSSGRRGLSSRKTYDGERAELLERLVAERRWTEIDPVEFLQVFENLSEDARASRSNTGWSDYGLQARETLERLVGVALGGARPRLRPDAPKSPLPDFAYLAEIGAQLERYQQGAAALAVLDAVQAADGGDSAAVLEERIFVEMKSRQELALKRGSQTSAGSGARVCEALSEATLRITAAGAARELMLAYRRLVQQLKTETGIRRHFGIVERHPK